MEIVYNARVKICCIASAEELQLAVRYGAAALGLVSAMPSGPGVIPEGRIRALARLAPPAVATFLLTAEQDPEAVIAQQRRLGASTLQLVDQLAPDDPPAGYARLRAALPGIKLVQVLHVRGEETIRDAEALAPHVDGLLLDSGNPSLAIKELGGTGRVHDWLISAQIRQRVACPVFLAGGLTPQNVAEAVRTVRPFGIDVCSGVRTQGALDEQKLAAFMRAVRDGAHGA